MVGTFLHILLYTTHLGDRDYVKLDEGCTSQESDVTMNPKKYIKGGDVSGNNSLNGNPHYLWGNDFYERRVLYCVRLTSEIKVFGTVRYKLSVPSAVLRGKISRVQVFDRLEPGKGGNVRIVEGGVNNTFVVLFFQSRRTMLMDYVVSIIGKPIRK